MVFDVDEKDDFWEIEKLVPKKKNTLTQFSHQEKVVDFDIGTSTKETNTETHLTVPPKETGKEENLIYRYNNGLISSVRINKFSDKFDFYGNFRKAALLYYDYKTPKCEFVPFYSYMPQYTQFNAMQKKYYFYWRDCIRRGVYIKTDYSYFFLYVYEILNLPDKIPAPEGLKLLVSTWKAYRNELSELDGFMSLIVQDYCLVYNLPCPMEELSDFIFDIITVAEFKEFYLTDIETMGKSGVSALLACLSDYDWRRGKYAGGENKDVYKKHMLAAMERLTVYMWQSGQFYSDKENCSTITRNAFKNCLCTHMVKCRLEITYTPISMVSDLRTSVTAAIRYTENKLREIIGVKSRLAIKGLPDSYKKIIDEYFSDIIRKANIKRIKDYAPEYEKLYEAADQNLSFDSAEEIEKASWTTTARLVENTEEESEMQTDFLSSADSDAVYEKDAFIPETESVNMDEQNDSTAEKYGLTDKEIEFVRAVLSSDMNKVKAISDETGVLKEALLDKVNEAFYQGFGDIIIEDNDGEFSVIEDYAEDIEQWLSKIQK